MIKMPAKPKLQIDTIEVLVDELFDDYLETNEQDELGTVISHCAFPGCFMDSTTYRPCQVITAPRDIYTSHFRPMLNPDSYPRSLPPSIDFTIYNDYDRRSRRRIGFREGPNAGVGMLDLLTSRDKFTDSYLSVPELFGRGASHVQFSFGFDDRGLPASSSHYELLPIRCWCSSDRTISRYQLALYVSYVFWLHQHLLQLPPFRQLRLLSLHVDTDTEAWIAEIMVINSTARMPSCRPRL